ncbi:MAG TPA: amino acid permease [Gemmatimonadaceae bacterium]|nr:amino acid permease [Gemmatimonadaceae bacterium]
MSTAPVASGRGETKLVRALSLREAAALVIGTVIGTGIFLKTAPMSQLLGSPSMVLFAWVAAGLLSLAGALTYAELGAMLPKAGGEYVFLREAYGDLLAFLFGWANMAIIATGAIAALGTAFASFLSAFVPMSAVYAERTFQLLGQEVHWEFGIRQVVAIAVILLFTAVNTVGVAVSGRIQWLLTAAKVLGITVIVGGAFLLSRAASWDHLSAPVTSSPTAGGVSAFGAAMIAALWAYQGWSHMPMVAGEMKNPERDIPRGLIYGMLIVLAIYLLTNIAYFYALPFNEIVTSSSTAYRDALPVATKATQSYLGEKASAVVTIAFLLSLIGALNGVVVMNARVPYAMARDGLFFPGLGKLASGTGVPARAVWAQGIWGALLALSGTFDQLTTSSIFAVWIFFALAAGAVLVLRKKMPDIPRPYRTFGYPFVPILFILVATWLVINTLRTNPVESGAGLVLIALGIPFYLYFRRNRANGSMRDPI